VDRLARLAFPGSDEHQKILWGYIHERNGREKLLYQGLLSCLMRLGWGLEFARLLHGLWHIAWHGWIHEVTNFEGIFEVNSYCLLGPDSLGVHGRGRWPLD